MPRCQEHNFTYIGIRCPKCAGEQLTAPELGGEPVRLRHDQLAPGVAKAILAAGSPQEAAEAITAGANAIQVGGDHYKASYQHWDFVADLDLDYFQACATKYVTRRRKKNGLEDLEKAPHYMMKRAELVKAERIQAKDVGGGWPLEKLADFVHRLAKANGLDAYDVEAIWLIVLGRDEQARDKLRELVAHATPEAAAE